MILNYDMNRLEQLLESFYALTHIRIVLFDDQLQIVAAYPASDCDFCSLVRACPETRERCQESDSHACRQCQRTGAIYRYTCHAGLTEVVTPIRCGNITAGYIMFGQVLTQPPSEAHWNEIRQRFPTLSIPEAALKAAYFHKHTNSEEELMASVQILEACAGYLYLQRMISLQEDTLPRQLDEYLTGNLQADLSISALCNRFGVSRSKLYKTVREYYGMGIEQLTRTLRVDAARRLLRQTALPVTEIAARVGYGDYNYFIKVFRKETGLTPVRYRKADS